MKRFLIKLIVFLLIVAVSDLTMGTLICLYDEMSGGELAKIHTIITKETPEILILGSSRASHHYNSRQIKDSLNMTVFNAGLNGRGTTSAYCILKSVGQRSYPDFILCEVTPGYDLYKEGGPIRINDFYPYIKLNDIKKVIVDFDSSEQYKLLSNSYRFNSVIFSLLGSIIIERDKYTDGYEPLQGLLNPSKIKPKKQTDNPKQKDTTKEKYLRKLIEEATSHNCKMVFSVSPIFKGKDITEYEDEFNIIQSYGLPILNHLNDLRFINDSTLFQDYNHLNKEGASIYTDIIIDEIRPLIQE